MTDKEKIELELLQIIDSNSKPEGAIVLIEEKIKDIVYIHFQQDTMHYVSPKNIVSFFGRQMVKEETIHKLIKNRYVQIIQIPFDYRN